MANWCSTSFKIVGPPPELRHLYNKIEDAKQKAYIENAWGDAWLGNFFSLLGYSESDIATGPACRGYFSCVELDGGTLTMETETAWGPMFGPIEAMIKAFAPSCDFKYLAIEPGNCLYESNDDEYIGTYLVDIWDDYELPETLKKLDYDFLSEEDLIEVLIDSLSNIYPSVETLPTEQLIKYAESLWSEKLSINRVEEAWI